MEQLNIFAKRLPKKPYCSDSPQDMGLIIRSMETAVKRRYIQPNCPNSKAWLLFDIDRQTCISELTDDMHLPVPTLFVQDYQSKKAHALYGVETPIHHNANSSLAAIRFAGAVDVAMSVQMDADAQFCGLITKNPLNPHWHTYATGGMYELNELAEYVDLSAANDRRYKLASIGLGRNCNLFESLRKWAYKAIRQGWPAYNQWLIACTDRACALNLGVESQLHVSEVVHIAKSVAKWTYRNLTQASFNEYVTRTHTPEIQARRGSKGGKVSAQNKRNKREAAIVEAITELQSQGKKPSKAAVGRMVGMSREKVSRLYSHLF